MKQIGLNSNRIINFKSTQETHLQQNTQVSNEQYLSSVPLPQIYNVPSEVEKPDLVEQIKKFDMFGIIYPWLLYPFTLLATCTGMAWGLDKFSQACGGDYEKSLVGKAANLGDKIENSKFVKSKPFQVVWGAGKNTVRKVKHFFRNSDLLNAIFKNPSNPEWGMVKDELLGMKHRVIHEFTNICKTLKWTEEGFTTLTDLGLDKEERKFLKEIFGDVNLTSIEEKASNAVRLRRLELMKQVNQNEAINIETIKSIVEGVNATEIVKAKELEHIGLTTDFLKKIEKNTPTLRDIVRIEQACDKGHNMRIGAGHQKFLGPFQPFERKASLAEIRNRLKSMIKGSKTGRFLATFLQKCHRGFTFGGHKMNAIFFVSPILVETMMDVKKAEPNEKLGTAAHGLIHSVSWVFTFPLALKLMHHLGGMQYAGMSKADVETARNLIKEFNEKANPFVNESWTNIFGIGEKKSHEQVFYKTYKDYQEGLRDLNKQLKTLRNKNTKNQNLITKIGKQLGRFLTLDLETISSYKNGSTIGNIARSIPNFFKNVVGVPMRFILWGAITMGVFDAIINKGIKGCFGNFYDRFKEEEFVNAKKEQKKFLKEDLKVRLNEANQRKAFGLENSIAKGDFSQENLTTLAPSLTTQRPKNNKQEEIGLVKSSQVLKEENNNALLNNNIQDKTLDDNGKTRLDQINKNTNIGQEPLLTKSIVLENPAIQDNIVKEDKSDLTQAKSINPNNAQEEIKDSYNYIPNSNSVAINKEAKTNRDNYTYIPSSENLLKKNQSPQEAKKYIPSQIGVKFNKTFDNSGLEGALRRADRAEQLALRTLAGDFNSY